MGNQASTVSHACSLPQHADLLAQRIDDLLSPAFVAAGMPITHRAPTSSYILSTFPFTSSGARRDDQYSPTLYDEKHCVFQSNVESLQSLTKRHDSFFSVPAQYAAPSMGRSPLCLPDQAGDWQDCISGAPNMQQQIQLKIQHMFIGSTSDPPARFWSTGHRNPAAPTA